MNIPRLLLLGASGFGREVLWVIDDIPPENRQWTVAGFLDDDVDGARRSLAQNGITLPVFGAIRDHVPRADECFFCAIGGARARLAVSEQLASQGARFINLIHPSALVHPTAALGTGVLLSPLTTVGPNSSVGNYVVFNASAAVRSDTRIDDGAFLGARCEIMDSAHLERGAFLGSHVTVHPHASVEAFATVGIGSVVLRRVERNTTVLGVPAKRFAS